MFMFNDFFFMFHPFSFLLEELAIQQILIENDEMYGPNPAQPFFVLSIFLVHPFLRLLLLTVPLLLTGYKFGLN